MSRRRYLLIGLFGVFLLLVGALILSWVQIERKLSGPELKSLIEENGSKFLQRPLTIEELRWQGWPTWVLTGKNVRLWDNSKKQGLLIQSPTVEARLTLLSFYRLAIGIKELKFVRPRVWNIQRITDGLSHSPKNSSEKTRRWGKIVFYEYVIEEGTVITPKADWFIAGRGKFTSPVFSGVVRSSTTEAEFDISMKTAPQPVTTFNLKKVRYLSTSLENIRVNVRREGETYTVEPTTFEGLGGTISVQSSYQPSASTDSLKVEWKTSGVQARDLFRLIGSSADVSGILDSSGRIESRPDEQFLSSLNGQIEIDLKNGRFGDAQGLLKILSKINLTTLITAAKGKHETRVPFDATHGTFKIVNGVASTVKPFVLENKTVQMAFMGDYNLPEKTIEGKMVVNVLLVTDEIINKIPFVRDILLGDEKGFIPIWLSVKGDAADPKIKVLSVKSIAGPAWNTIANTLRLPKKLLEKIRGE